MFISVGLQYELVLIVLVLLITWLVKVNSENTIIELKLPAGQLR